MALAFVRQQPFVASTLLGATILEQLKTNIDLEQLKTNIDLEQLKTNIDSYKVVLGEDVLEDVLQVLEEIHTRFTIPAS